jgi:peptidylprolyl isomerase
MKSAAVLRLLAPTTLFVSTALFAQTAPATKPPIHHTAAPAPLLNPPGAPKVVGLPKTMFTLRYVDLVVGKGELAQPRKFYTVNYTGWLPDGTKFDSSEDHGEPITFPYGARRVIAGWDVGFEGMHVGGKRRLYIPYQLAYGELGNPKIPGKSNLIFDVELVGQSDSPPVEPGPGAQTPPPAK